MSGAAPAGELLEREAKARRELALAREQLLAAMTEAITGEAPSIAAEPPRNTDGPKETS